MRILKGIDLEQVLFFDIECATVEQELTEDSIYYDSWFYKNRNSKEFDTKNFEEDVIKSFSEKASLYGEFCQVVTISIGHVKKEDGLINVTSFYKGCNEKVQTESDIIQAFFNALDSFKGKYGKVYLCGHAIKTYDIPVLFKRSLILGMESHELVDTSGLEPWKLTWMIDSLELFKATSFTPSSLMALAAAFGLPSPKQDINGSETSKCYWNGEVERIARYCERDVVTVANILLKMMRLPIVEKAINGLDFVDVPVLEKVAKLGKYTKKDLKVVLEQYSFLQKDGDKIIAEKIILTAFKKTVKELQEEL